MTKTTKKLPENIDFVVGQSVVWTDFDGDFGEVNREYQGLITGVRDSMKEQDCDCFFLELCTGVRIEALDYEIELV